MLCALKGGRTVSSWCNPNDGSVRHVSIIIAVWLLRLRPNDLPKGYPVSSWQRQEPCGSPTVLLGVVATMKYHSTIVLLPSAMLVPLL